MALAEIVNRKMNSGISNEGGAHGGSAIRCTVGLERNRLRAAQAKAVMPLIGGLLDAWDALTNDLRSDPELEHLKAQIERIDEAMETASSEKSDSEPSMACEPRSPWDDQTGKSGLVK